MAEVQQRQDVFLKFMYQCQQQPNPTCHFSCVAEVARKKPSIINMLHLLFNQLDVGTVYAQPDHRFCRRWAVMTDPEETLGASGAGIKVGGFLILLHFTMINCDTLDKLWPDEPLGLYADVTYLPAC